MSVTLHNQPFTDSGPYSRLRSNEIRLLRLVPGQKAPSTIQAVDDTPAAQAGITLGVKLEFETVSLTQKDCPDFIALSYTWGDPEDTVLTWVSGCRIQITRNLHAMLRSLAANDYSEKPRRLWIDAGGP